MAVIQEEENEGLDLGGKAGKVRMDGLRPSMGSSGFWRLMSCSGGKGVQTGGGGVVMSGTAYH